MPSEGVLDTSLSWVTPSSGKGALGKWRAPYRQHRLDSEPGCGDHLAGRRAGGITRYLRGVYERAFKPREIGEGPLGTGCCCQPDSGNPTVRDERGGLRKRGLWWKLNGHVPRKRRNRQALT